MLGALPVPMLKDPADGALNAGAKFGPNPGAGALAPPKPAAGLDPNAGAAPEKLKPPLFGASPAAKENDDALAGAPKVNVDDGGLLAPKTPDDPAPNAGVALAPVPNAPAPVCGALKLPLLPPKVEGLAAAEPPKPNAPLPGSAALAALPPPPNGVAALAPNAPAKLAFASGFCAVVPELNAVPNIFGGSCFGAEKLAPKAGGGLLVLPKAGELVPKAADGAAKVEFVLAPPNDGAVVVAVPNVGFADAPNGEADVVVVPGTIIIGYS